MVDFIIKTRILSITLRKSKPYRISVESLSAGFLRATSLTFFVPARTRLLKQDIFCLNANKL